MIDNTIPHIQTKLNYDVHPSLLEDRDIVYLLNGDIKSNDGGTNWFVQNQLGNKLCYEFPEGYELKGTIRLNNNDHVLFFKTSDSYEIGRLYVDECWYETWVNSPCLNLEYNVRGVYKFLNSDNGIRIYFIDGENYNRYADIDKPYPKKYTGSKCENCSVEYTEELDCESLRIHKTYNKPCIHLEKTEDGNLLSGVYQIGVAYAIDNVVLTDYTFSPAIKVFSEASNIGLKCEISCDDNSFDQVSLILVSNTRENSLVTYNLGFFPISNTNISITSVDNKTILSTSQAISRRTILDQSKHIVTNGETLLVGKHRILDNLDYQQYANSITTKWVEFKIPKSQSKFYPSLMRDEVYGFNIEWYGKRGNLRGTYHIPGRAPTIDDLTEYVGDEYITNDIYEVEDCNPATLKKWQIENTASIDQTYNVSCTDCSGTAVNKLGTMGYWESQDYVYPNDTDKWGELACQPIRHHRMPSHDLSHIHDDFEIVVSPPGDCYEECYTIAIQVAFETIYEEVCETICPSGETSVVEADCINILAVQFSDIIYPKLPDLTNDPDISGYQITVTDRNGNKSILHKGLIFNMGKDTSTTDTEILYPNYPFNDLHPDVFLSTVQTTNNQAGTGTAGYSPVSSGFFAKDQFTYHSPDIHYREIKQEFGTEMKIYGEEIGPITGYFDNVYKHPKTRIGVGGITTLGYNNNAKQVNSICNYSDFYAWTSPLFSRFKIEASQYLLPVNQITSNNKKVNNYLRESSYYLSLNRELSHPTNDDVSRILSSEKGGYYSYPQEVSRYDVDASGMVDKMIQGVSYYVGIKIKQPNQYGSLDSTSYRPVGCFHKVEPSGETTFTSDIIFAGDIYITQHSLLRKMPLFTEWLEDVEITTETNYRDYRNIWYPRFWYDNASYTNDNYNLDGSSVNLGSGDYISYAPFYIFVTGVINFWCESEFIGDYRERDFTPNGNFYPKINYRDIAKTDKIRYDNKFLYNFSLLSNEVERRYLSLKQTKSDNDFIVAYSLKDDPQSSDDKWLQFLPLNYTLLPRIYGDFTGMHYTDDYSIFFAFENQILYSQMNYSLQTTEGNSLLITQGDIFSNRLRRLSNDITGYVGCVDPLSFVNTRYGTFFFDRYRRKFFLWNGQIKDVTGTMSSWLQHFTNPPQQEYNDSTVVSIYDNYTDNIYIRGTSERSPWTLSFKPEIMSWVSFHSFTPRYFLSNNNTFLSADLIGIWKHNDEFNYQSYYGEQVSFDVGFVVNNKFKNKEIQGVEIFAEFIKQSLYGSPIYRIDKFFDKLFAYNNNGSTGFLSLLLKDKSNPSQSIIQNQESNPIIAEVSRVYDSVYRINKFENLRVDHFNQPLLLLDNNGMDYIPQSTSNLISPTQREDIKGKWLILHLRSETNLDHKILLQLSVTNSDEIKT